MTAPATAVESQRVPFLVKATLLLVFTFLDVCLSATVDFGNVPSEPGFLRFVFLAYGRQWLNGGEECAAAAGHVRGAGAGARSIQLIIQVANGLVVFLMLSGTYLFQVKITENASEYGMWDDNGFYLVGVLQKLVSIVYLFTMLSTAFRLGQRRWYAKEPWVRRFREQYPTGGSMGLTDID